MLNKLARAPRLAVVSDFDGTLAGFAADRWAVSAEPRSLAALEKLARLPQTWAGVLSGRDLAGLQRVCPTSDAVIRGGSHGAETTGQAPELDPAARAELARVEGQLRQLAARFPGADVETKAFQVVLHVRALEESDPAAALAAVEAAQDLATNLHRTLGKSVVEYSASASTKGTWLQQLRAHTQATLVFLGDDVTDEDGFSVLDPARGDLGVKVGPGDTQAAHRVADVQAVADFLEELAAARQVACSAGL